MKKKRVVSNLVGKTSKNILRGLKYHSNKVLNKPQDLTFLVYSVTRKCNSRCVMCNIWKDEYCQELTLQEIKNILCGAFFSKLKYVNLTGGEPFLRKDLAEIVSIFGELPHLKAIQIPTNGFLTQKIVETTDSILRQLSPDIYLSISVSIDGDESIHDKIRGTKGAYDKATKTLQQLQSIEDPRLIVGVATTVLRANIYSIEEIYNHLKNLSDHVGFYPAISSSSFYRNENNEAVQKDSLYIQKAIQFFSLIRDNEPEHAFYYDEIVNILQTGIRSFECLAGQKTAYLSADGELFPCLMLSDKEGYSFGSPLGGKAIEAWKGTEGSLIRKKLTNNPVCSRCSLSCDLINNLNEEFFEMAFFYLKNPRISIKLLNDIRQNKIKSKNLSE